MIEWQSWPYCEQIASLTLVFGSFCSVIDRMDYCPTYQQVQIMCNFYIAVLHSARHVLNSSTVSYRDYLILTLKQTSEDTCYMNILPRILLN